MYTTIITLYKQGVSQRQIAKTTKVNRKTVQKIIHNYRTKQIQEPPPYERCSMLDGWHQQIVLLLEQNLSCVRILEELQLLGFKGSYSSLTRYIKKHNIKNNTCIRFNTQPGEEAQVDFGAIGLKLDRTGKKRKAYVFNMRLSYSRMDYYEVVFDQSCQTWIQCHLNAFNYFGGVPKVVKLDNLKAGVLDSNFYEPVLQKEYQRFAEHYGFLLSPCRVYQPQEKGKVESGIKYVKNNFFAGREFKSFEQLASDLAGWVEKANSRLHGTTKKVPYELFNGKERLYLSELPQAEFELSTWHYRKVARDCHITIDNNYYSVPAKYACCEVMVQLSLQLVQIYNQHHELIATHARSKSQGVFTTELTHYAKNKRLCPGFAEHDQKLTQQLQAMGPNCSLMLEHLQQARPKDWYRPAKGIVNLLKLYNNELIDQACKRALYYGVTSYKQIEKMLINNAIALPLPTGGDDYANFA